MPSRLLLPLMLTFTLTLGLATAVQAAPSIQAAGFGGGIVFSTEFDYSQAWLRVTGPNSYTQELTFDSLAELALSLDVGAVDGDYHWQIVAAKATGPRELMRSAEADSLSVERPTLPGKPVSATFHGSFQVRSGLIELPSASLSTDGQDVFEKKFFGEDVYIDGQLCVGADCVNNENLGADTVRLKENNIRIHFLDSSSSQSFPSNDWQLTVNSSQNGGDSFFSLDDLTGGTTPFRVDAGAPDHALRIAANGRVGLGTSTPAQDLHIQSGDNPTFRLEQDGSNGFTAQTWDLLGNEVNFAIRDSNKNTLPLRILDDAKDDTLVLTHDGYAGVNEDAAKARLHVRESGSTHDPSNDAVIALFQRDQNSGDGSIISVLSGSGGNAQIFLGDKDDDKAGRVIYRNASDALSLWTAGSERLFIESDGQVCIGCNDTQGDAIRHSNGAVLTAGGTWTNASSRGLKQDITELSGAEAMAALDGLAPVTYRYKAELDETYVGFIAEDVPELVAMKDRKSLTSMDVVAVLTKVVQEQRLAFEQQRALYDAQLEALQTRLQALESVD